MGFCLYSVLILITGGIVVCVENSALVSDPWLILWIVWWILAAVLCFFLYLLSVYYPLFRVLVYCGNILCLSILRSYHVIKKLQGSGVVKSWFFFAFRGFSWF